MSKKQEPRRMDIRVLPIAQLNPAVYNPRVELKPGMPEYDKLKLGIETFGLVEPLVVNERTGWTIVGGHQRYNILKARGDTEVECSVVDLAPGEEKALNIALNKLSGSWDMPKLKDLMEELDVGAFDMDLTGFGETEIAELMSQFHVDELDEKYTQKIIAPVYEPKGKKPKIAELYDDAKTRELTAQIEASDLPPDIADFLKLAAQRHTAFHFANIAEWYCHSTPEVQDLMERSGMVIIDFNKAIEYGFVHLVESLQALAQEEADNA